MSLEKNTIKPIANEKLGSVLICDHEGNVQDVLLNKLFLPEDIVKGHSWFNILDEQSHDKGKYFEHELREKGVLLNWELNTLVEGTLQSIRFAGILIKDNMLIIADQTNEGLSRLMEEYMKMG